MLLDMAIVQIRTWLLLQLGLFLKKILKGDIGCISRREFVEAISLYLNQRSSLASNDFSKFCSCGGKRDNVQNYGSSQIKMFHFSTKSKGSISLLLFNSGSAKVKHPEMLSARNNPPRLPKRREIKPIKISSGRKPLDFILKLLNSAKNKATYYSNRAQAYLELGSYLQAEADCTKAISLDKKSVKAYFRRGAAREMLGYYKEAIDDFKYVLALEPWLQKGCFSC